MAKIGLNNFWYSILASESSAGVPTYSGPQTPGKAVECSVDAEFNDAELYAEDGLAESDKSFKKATVNITVDRDDLQTKADLLGHTLSSGELKSNSEDVAPYVGIGRVVTMIVGGVKKYIGKVIYKVKFAEPQESEKTKGDSTEFGTTQYSGTASTLANGDWKTEKAFDDKQDAIDYVKGLLASSSNSSQT